MNQLNTKINLLKKISYTNKETTHTNIYVSSIACELLRRIMLNSMNQIECEVLLGIRHQTLIYLLKFIKGNNITDKRTVNISTGPKKPNITETQNKNKQLIYRINILCTNSFVTSIEINTQSLPSPEEIFTTIDRCHRYTGSTCNISDVECGKTFLIYVCIQQMCALLWRLLTLQYILCTLIYSVMKHVCHKTITCLKTDIYEQISVYSNNKGDINNALLMLCAQHDPSARVSV